MNKIFFSLLSIVFVYHASFSMNKETESYEEKQETLMSVGHRYLFFLDDFGKKNPSNQLKERMKTLFAPKVRKWVNGVLVAETFEELHNQIEKVKNDPKDGIGTWEVFKASEILTSPETNTAIAHFEIPTEKKGTIVVMKKLICDNNGLIKEINEVFNFKAK